MYQRPCGAPVSDGGSYDDHRHRTPPSEEPGTDYACGYGTEVRAAESGTVSGVKSTNSGAMGRYVAIALDDGNSVRYLHLSQPLVAVGARVERGAVIGRSGGSGFNSDTHYGSHVHATLWIGEAWRSTPVDFERHTGGQAIAGLSPRVEDDDMLALKIKSGGQEFLCALGPGIFRHFIASDPFEKIMRLMRIQDDWQFIDLSELPALLRTYGCDLNIWDIRNGDFAVLDPLDGSVRPGNMWSSAAAVRAALAGLFVPVIDNSPALDEVARWNEEFGVDLEEPYEEVPPPNLY